MVLASGRISDVALRLARDRSLSDKKSHFLLWTSRGQGEQLGQLPLKIMLRPRNSKIYFIPKTPQRQTVVHFARTLKILAPTRLLAVTYPQDSGIFTHFSAYFHGFYSISILLSSGLELIEFSTISLNYEPSQDQDNI